jgi:hypothetical protein
VPEQRELTFRALLSHVFTFEGRASNAIRSGKGKAVMQAAAVGP